MQRDRCAPAAAPTHHVHATPHEAGRCLVGAPHNCTMRGEPTKGVGPCRSLPARPRQLADFWFVHVHLARRGGSRRVPKAAGACPLASSVARRASRRATKRAPVPAGGAPPSCEHRRGSHAPEARASPRAAPRHYALTDLVGRPPLPRCAPGRETTIRGARHRARRRRRADARRQLRRHHAGTNTRLGPGVLLAGPPKAASASDLLCRRTPAWTPRGEPTMRAGLPR